MQCSNISQNLFKTVGYGAIGISVTIAVGSVVIGAISLLSSSFPSAAAGIGHKGLIAMVAAGSGWTGLVSIAFLIYRLKAQTSQIATSQEEPDLPDCCEDIKTDSIEIIKAFLVRLNFRGTAHEPLSEDEIDKLLHTPNFILTYRNTTAGLTLLHIAVIKRARKVMEAILACEPTLIHVTNRNQTTALHLAALRGKLSIVKRLIQYKSNVNAKNTNGATPLDLAKKFKRKKIVKILEEAGLN